MQKTILFMGPPGVGKGTFSQKLIKNFGVCHISTGNIFRTEIKEKTPIGLKALTFIEAGELVPDEVTDEMVLNRVQEEDAKNKAILLDGYPRNLHQADKIVEILKTINKQLDIVVWLYASQDILIERIVNRRLCKFCGQVYNMKSLIPKVEGKCDKCEGEIYQRIDDTKGKVIARLNEYNKVTLPLLTRYKKEGILVEIDSNNDINTTYETLKTVIGVK